MTITEEVQAAFESWGSAWNKGDLDGYLAGYHNSDDLRVVYNMHIIRGKQAIVGMNKSQFTSSESMGQLSVKEMEIEPIGDSDALVFGIMERTGERPVTATFTAHLRKIKGAWVIVSEHGAT